MAYGEQSDENSVYMFDKYEYDRADSPSAYRPDRNLWKKFKSCFSDIGGA